MLAGPITITSVEVSTRTNGQSALRRVRAGHSEYQVSDVKTQVGCGQFVEFAAIRFYVTGYR